MHKDDIQQGQTKRCCNAVCVGFCCSYNHITIAAQCPFRVYLCLKVTVTMNFILSFPISICNIVETTPSLLVQYHVLTKCMYHHLRKRKQVLLFLPNPRKTLLAGKISHGATADTAVTAKKWYKLGF